MTLPMGMSPMEGLGNIYVHPYMGIDDLQEQVRSQCAELQTAGTNQQYLVFRGVTKRDLTKMDRERDTIGKDTRMSYYADSNLLIIKLMPSVAHEMSHLSLAKKLDRALGRMGIPEEALVPLGAGRFSSTRSSKEADGAFKPDSRESKSDWPTLVFESGLSESLSRLRCDAAWWLEKSRGDVKLVIIISVRSAKKELRVEKWCLCPPPPNRPVTRACSSPNSVPPTKVQHIVITQNQTPGQPIQQANTAPPTVIVLPGATPSYVVTGAPLILEFQKIFLRAPVPPEGDIVLSAMDLSLWANGFWKCVK